MSPEVWMRSLTSWGEDEGALVEIFFGLKMEGDRVWAVVSRAGVERSREFFGASRWQRLCHAMCYLRDEVEDMCARGALWADEARSVPLRVEDVMSGL